MDILCRDALEVGRVDCGELSEDIVKAWCFLGAGKARENYQKCRRSEDGGGIVFMSSMESGERRFLWWTARGGCADM